MSTAGQVNLRSIFGHHVEGSCVFAEFSPESTGRFRGKIVVADPLLGTAPLKNASELSGNIALILRGSGADAAKARTAEACGAIGVIFGSTGETFAAKSDGKDVGIPCVMVEKSIYDQVMSQNMLDPLAWFADIERRNTGTIASAGGIKQALAQGQVLNLEVTVLRGKDLHRAENVGKLDPYVEMAVGDQVRRTKTDREGAQNPAWNQKLKFKLDRERLALGVTLRCMDEETLKASELIGAAPVDLEGALVAGATSFQVPLLNEFKLAAGSVQINITISDRTIKNTPSSRLEGQEQLEVHVIGAEGLYYPPNSTGFDKPAPFCKVQVGGQCKRTRTQPPSDSARAQAPAWGDRLALRLPQLEEGAEGCELELEIWDQKGERDGGGRSELLGSTEAVNVAKLLGNTGTWEGSLSLRHPQEPAAGKVRLKLTRLSSPSVEAAASSSGPQSSGSKRRHPTRIDPMVSLFLMMTAMLVLVIPFLRSAFLRLIPAIIQSLLVSLLLIAGIVWVKSRTLLADVIKGALGTVCNVGELVESYGGHRSFVSSVSLSNLPLSTLASFLATGTLSVQQLIVPNPRSFEEALGQEGQAGRALLRAERASVQVALGSVWCAVLVVQRLVVSGGELIVHLDDAMRSNIQALLDDAATFFEAAGRILGQQHVTTRQILFSAGTLRVRSPTLGAEELVVPVRKIELNGASSRVVGGGRGGSAVKRLIYKLIQAAHEAKQTGGEVELQVHCDLEKELEEDGSESEEEAGRAPVFDASQFSTVRAGDVAGGNGGGEDEEDDDSYIAY